jgi:23S rRNA (uracil1939-C5)-methyltransferase
LGGTIGRARSLGVNPEPRPRCPHYPDCAGCALIGTPYTAQLRAKRARVIDALAAYPRLAALAVPAVVGSARLFEYRNQAKLVVRRARRGLLLGVYRPGTHRVVDISACAVHQAPINAVLAGVRAAVDHSRAPIFDERSGAGWLRYVVVRSSAWKKSAQLVLVVRDRRWAGEAALLQRLRKLRGVSSVVLNLNDAPGNAIFGDTFVGATRETALVDRVGGLTLTSRAGAFLQANLGAARRVYEQVLRWGDPEADEVAVDLYCGVGAISFYLAGSARLVVGVEESSNAVLDAKQNIRLNGYHNVRFLNAAAAVGLAQIAAEVDRVGLVTLNPPRKGADLATREAIIACAPRRIVYVSCDPLSLSRDLDWLAARGYCVAALQPFDLLPQTEHVETVVLLRRAGAGPARTTPTTDEMDNVGLGQKSV